MSEKHMSKSEAIRRLTKERANLLSEVERLEAELKAEREQLEEITNVAISVGGYPESTPNAVGQPVSTEPSPLDMVEWLASELKAERGRGDKLQAALGEVVAKVVDADIMQGKRLHGFDVSDGNGNRLALAFYDQCDVNDALAALSFDIEAIREKHGLDANP